MKDRLITLAIFAISTMQLLGQSVTGDWEGNLEVQGNTLNIIFHITESNGIYSSTMDSPMQGAMGIEMDETTFEGNKLTIKKAQMSMETVAEFDPPSDMIKGNFNQGPMSLPLTLKRMEDVSKEKPTNNHPIAGDWNGALDVMGTQLRLVFHITELNGELSSTMDSPDQGSFGFATDKTQFDENKVLIEIDAMKIKVEGIFLPDSNIISGKFHQSGQTFPLKLSREAIAKKEVNRPQEPKTFDYKVEEVKFENPDGGHSLAGTLTIPKSGKFDKVIVLVSGSGPQDRNEELLGHKPFLVLSDYLTKNGIAVLRYDDRGVGESGGDFSEGTSMDFAEDAAVAVDFLRSKPEMKGKKIGVMGHSEGGLIAPIVSTKTELDFIVLLAGPGTDSDALLLEQTEAILLANGEDKDEVNMNIGSSKMIFDYMNAHPAMALDDLREGMREILKERFKLLPKEDLEEIGDVDKEIENQIKSVTTPWFRYFLNYKPSEYLSKVTIPVLAVNGSLDLQVLPESNLSGIDKSLKKAGNKHYTIKEFEGLNHLFQVSEDGTGSPNEYGKIEETFNEEAMIYITDWVKNFDN